MELLTGCSPELVDRVRALGLPHDGYEVIPYGVDSRTFHPRTPNQDPEAAAWRERLGIGEDKTVVLGVGRMATKKGFSSSA